MSQVSSKPAWYCSTKCPQDTELSLLLPDRIYSPQHSEVFTQTEERGMLVHRVILIGPLISVLIIVESMSVAIAQTERLLIKTA